MSTRGPWILYWLLALVFTIATVYVGIDYGESHSPSSVALEKPTATTTKKGSITPIPPRHICSSSFEAGMVIPAWSPSGYGATDTHFAQALPAIRTVTSACWLEMTLPMKMNATNSLVLDTSGTPSLQNFQEGVVNAKSYGFHIFVAPLLMVSIPGDWAGSIQFHSLAGETSWFNLLFDTYAPYIKVAQALHVEQLSIGREMEWMQRNAPDSLWENYITKVRGIYQGTITYDTNWDDLADPMTPWMRQLSTLGVSEYMPLVDRPWRIAPPAMDALFRTRVLPRIDALSKELGKPVIVTEMGFRDSADPFYNPWDYTIKQAQDQQEQAWAVQAALDNLTVDPHIAGTFLWAWRDSGPYDLQNTQAATVIGTIYKKI